MNAAQRVPHPYMAPYGMLTPHMLAPSLFPPQGGVHQVQSDSVFTNMVPPAVALSSSQASVKREQDEYPQGPTPSGSAAAEVDGAGAPEAKRAKKSGAEETLNLLADLCSAREK
jgi:hypothetical protein